MTRGREIDLVGWAERFIATPSISRNGNAAIAALAAELATEAGLAPKLDERQLDGVPQLTLRVDLGPDRGDGLLMLTHLDTVPPGELGAWTATGGDPFRPTRSGDRLYGLGSADAKVDLICKIAALAGVDPGRLQRPVRLVGTYAEEIGLVGARDFVERGGTAGMRYALIGEPSELVAIRAHKGYAVYEAQIDLPPAGPVAGAAQVARESVRGVSAHSSTPQLGVNAIEAALERLARADVVGMHAAAGGDAVNKVPDLCHLDLALAGADSGARSRPRQSAALDPAPLIAFAGAWRRLRSELAQRRDSDFDPDHTVANLGVMRTVGSRISLSFDVRPVPGAEVEQALARLAPHASLRLVRVNPPLATSLDSPLLAAVARAQQQVGLAVRVGTKATSTEAGVIAAAGLDAVILGAGLSVGNVHKPNEHTRISELSLARDLYRSVIEQLCMERAPCSC